MNGTLFYTVFKLVSGVRFVAVIVEEQSKKCSNWRFHVEGDAYPRDIRTDSKNFNGSAETDICGEHQLRV